MGEGGWWKNILVKYLAVGQKILISKRGCIMAQVNFLKRSQRIFGKNCIVAG